MVKPFTWLQSQEFQVVVVKVYLVYDVFWKYSLLAYVLGHTNINKRLENRNLPRQILTYFQCTLSLPPENIRKSCGFLLFSGDREKVHWEEMDELIYSQPLFWSLMNRKFFDQKLKCKDF